MKPEKTTMPTVRSSLSSIASNALGPQGPMRGAGAAARVRGERTGAGWAFSIAALTSAPSISATLVSHSQTSRMIAAAKEP